MTARTYSIVASAGPTRLPRIRTGLPVAPGIFSPGNFPDSDELSLTVCPVHALSTGSKEWVEMAWAARDAVHKDVNLERRGWFESIKCLLLERDLPPSRISVRPLLNGTQR